MGEFGGVGLVGPARRELLVRFWVGLGYFGSVSSDFGAEIRGFGSLFASIGAGRRLIGARRYF